MNRSDKKLRWLESQVNSPLTPKGHHAQRGYGPARRIYEQRCQTCQNEKKIRGIGGTWVDCPRCSEE